MGHRGRLREVELVDDRADEPTAASRPRPRRRWVVVGVAAAVLALGVNQGVVTARERAAVARLAEVPGVLAPVDEQLTVAERISDDDAGRLYGYRAGPVRHARDGSQTFTWVDDTGAGWTVDLLGPSTPLADLGRRNVVGGSTCRPDNEPGSATRTAQRVVCLVVDGGYLLDGASGIARVPSTLHRVVVLAAADGAVVASWAVDRGDGLVVLPGDLVVLGSTSADDTQVAAYDVLTGEPRWARLDPLPSPDDLVDVGLFRVGDLVASSTPAHPLTLLAPDDGEVVRVLPSRSGSGWTTDSRTGGLVLLDRTADGGSRSTLVGPDGDPAGDVSVLGNVLAPSVDDGSVPGLLLTSDGGVRAWDRTTGAPRWSRAGASPTSAIVARGRVYLGSHLGVDAVDGATGATLWSAPAEPRLTLGALLTDGRHLLVPFDAVAGDAEPVLVARDLDAGRVVFRADYPAGVREVSAVDRRLVGRDPSANELVVLD